MANPLQPKVIKCLEDEYNAFVVVPIGTTKSGIMDVIACIPTPKYLYPKLVDNRYPNGPMEACERQGLFYGFEVKWKSDQPSELQKRKINELIDAGGRGYFIRSVEQLRAILDGSLIPVRYDLNKHHEI